MDEMKDTPPKARFTAVLPIDGITKMEYNVPVYSNEELIGTGTVKVGVDEPATIEVVVVSEAFATMLGRMVSEELSIGVMGRYSMEARNHDRK